MREVVVGDKVRCIKEVVFTGLGGKHEVGRVMLVNESNKNYWNSPINEGHYEIVEDASGLEIKSTIPERPVHRKTVE